MTATPLQPITAAIDLLLVAHRNDPIFTVVQDGGRSGLMTVVPSALGGSRWVGTKTVADAFENTNGYLTGWEAYDAIFQNPTRPTVLLYRNLTDLVLYGSLT
jgi:hypothetical protein